VVTNLGFPLGVLSSGGAAPQPASWSLLSRSALSTYRFSRPAALGHGLVAWRRLDDRGLND
jgi:hypothetical protein